MADLKPGWQRVRFGDVVRLNKETCKDPEAEGIDRVIGLEHLEPGDLRIRSWADAGDGTTFTNRVRSGQVLFGKRRAYQRKVAVADFDAVCSGDIYVFESADHKRLLPEILPFVCQTEAFFEHAVGTSAGSLSPRTNWKSLAVYEFALPPLKEQRRMVSLLSKTTSILESQRALLDRLDQLSDAFLAHAISDSGQCYDKATLRSVCDLIVDCKNRTPPQAFAGHPVIRTSNIRKGKLLLEGIGYTSPDGYREWTRRAVPSYQDLVFTREAPFGEACLVPYGLSPCLGQRTMLFRADKRILLPGYLLVAVLSPPIQSQLLKLAGGSTVGHVRVQDMKSLQIPMPSLRTQRAIYNSYIRLQDSCEAVLQRSEEAKVFFRSALKDFLS
jgi:type I restriction enzyme, S subunit